MKTQILDRPDFSFVEVTFDEAGENLQAEAGALVARDVSVEMKTGLRGGLLASAKRKLLGGESLFVNTFTATAPGGRLLLAPGTEGDILAYEVRPGETLLAQSGSFLAAGTGVTLDTKWGGAKGFFGAGLFLLRAEGQGPLYLSAYGGLHVVELDGAEGFVADNAHVVAFTSGLDYDLRKVGGMKGLFFSGEGLVCHFAGRGRLFLQTRNPMSFAAWVHPFRGVRAG